MTANLSPDTSTATANMHAVGGAIVPIDDMFTTFFNFRTQVSIPLFGSSIEFSLQYIDRALYVSVVKAKQDLCSWVGGQPDPWHDPGLRQKIETHLYGKYLSTAKEFHAATGTITALIGQIGSGGATPVQQQQAAAALSTLDAIVQQAAADVAAVQAEYVPFQQRVEADIQAMQDGPAAIGAIIARVPHEILKWVGEQHPGVWSIGPTIKMVEMYAAAYTKALKKLQSGVQAGLGAGLQAGPAMVNLSTQWTTMASVTKDVHQQIAQAEQNGLKDALTALNLATAAQEWSALAEVAQNLTAQMNSEGIFGEGREVTI